MKGLAACSSAIRSRSKPPGLVPARSDVPSDSRPGENATETHKTGRSPGRQTIQPLSPGLQASVTGRTALLVPRFPAHRLFLNNLFSGLRSSRHAVGDVILVNICNVLGCFAAHNLGHGNLDIAEPFVTVVAHFLRKLSAAGDLGR